MASCRFKSGLPNMHNIQTPGGTSFNFNSDLSGDLHVVADNGSRVEFPCDDLVSLVNLMIEAGYAKVRVDEDGERTFMPAR